MLFSSESVTEGHPDKLADRISDSVLDALLRKDPFARVACEALVATEFICVAGEITAKPMGPDPTEAAAFIEPIARRAVRDIGYADAATGIGWDSAQFVSRIVPQSQDIKRGVGSRKTKEVGAGDQGLMFGYAQADGVPGAKPDFMPVPISLAHALARRLAHLRRSKKLSYLRPDGKSQVTVRFEKGEPVAVDAVVLAAQHAPDIDQETLHKDLIRECIREIVPAEWLHKKTKFYINYTGKFEKGGPASDCGLTGRKIIVDSYGGWVPHGGGAFSGKDATKVDRSAAYYARYVAKNLVAAGHAERVQIQVAYSIGAADPVGLHVQSFGTGNDAKLERLVRSEYDFSPGAIIEELGLRKPVYQPVTAYGHFGRTDLKLPWEAIRK